MYSFPIDRCVFKEEVVQMVMYKWLSGEKFYEKRLILIPELI